MKPLHQLRRYQDAAGRVPYSQWLGDLDIPTAARVGAYVDRMKTGNFGNSRSVGRGVVELKIDAGPGYRVYYLHDAGEIVILLCGGHKGTQTADIRRVHAHAGDCWERR